MSDFGRYVGPLEDKAQIITRLQVLEDLVSQLRDSVLVVTTVEPEKPREGMLRFADGVAWNPGAGAGRYEYVGGSWIKL